ncbi:MAG: hypothetical protein ACRC9Z_09435 [Weissella confusa]
MQKKTVIGITIALVSAMAMPVLVEANTDTVTYQTQGVARFTGSYTYPADSVVKPTDTHNPFYGAANEQHGQPVLPNTGAPSFVEQFGLALATFGLAISLAFYRVTRMHSNHFSSHS